MKKITKIIAGFILGIGLSLPLLAFATPSSVDRITDHIQPLIQSDYIRAPYFVASSTAGKLNFQGNGTVYKSITTNQTADTLDINDFDGNPYFEVQGEIANFAGYTKLGDVNNVAFGNSLTIDTGQGTSWFDGNLGVGTNGPPDNSLTIDVNGPIGNSRGSLSFTSANGVPGHEGGYDIDFNAGITDDSSSPDGSVHINGGNSLIGGNTYIGDNQSGQTFISNAVFTSNVAAPGFTMDPSQVNQLNIFTQSNTGAAASLYLTAAEGVSTNPDGSIFIQTEGPGPWGVGSINLEDNSGGGLNINELGAGDLALTSTHRILMSGSRIGIGTSSPFAALSVSTTTQGNGLIPLFDVASTTNATLFNVLGNGNVGIGTSSPADILDVRGAAAGSATKGECFGAKNANANTLTYWYFPTAGAAPVYQSTSCSGAGTSTVIFD